MVHVEHAAPGRGSRPPVAGTAGACGSGPTAAAGSQAGAVGEPAGADQLPRTGAESGARAARSAVRRVVGVLVLVVVALMPACAGVRSVRLYAPAASGLAPVQPRLYVDPAMTPAGRDAFAADLTAGRRRAEAFFGGLVASPAVVACASAACYRRFGGIGPKAVFRNGTILLSPEGLSPVIVAHELSHAELAARIGGFRTWWRVPQWFDEGIAVLASGDPEYTEEAWRRATDNGANVPALAALESLRGWLRVTGKDGKTKQLSYGTARHEVARWYAAAGPAGFRALIDNLRNGGDFRETYDRVARDGVGGGRSTWNGPAGRGAR